MYRDKDRQIKILNWR